MFSVGEQHSLIARFSKGCSGLLILSFCEIVNDSLTFWFLEVLFICVEEAGIFLLIFQRLLFFFLCSSAFPSNIAWCFRKSFTRNVTISLTPPSFSGVQVTEMVIFFFTLQLAAIRRHAEALACGAQQRQLHLQRLLVRVVQDQRPRPRRAHADIAEAEEGNGAEVAEQQHRRRRVLGRGISACAPPALLRAVSCLHRRHGSRPRRAVRYPPSGTRRLPGSQGPGQRSEGKKYLPNSRERSLAASARFK